MLINLKQWKNIKGFENVTIVCKGPQLLFYKVSLVFHSSFTRLKKLKMADKRVVSRGAMFNAKRSSVSMETQDLLKCKFQILCACLL